MKLFDKFREIFITEEDVYEDPPAPVPTKKPRLNIPQHSNVVNIPFNQAQVKVVIVEPVKFDDVFAEIKTFVERVRPMVADVSRILYEKGQKNEKILFEGAQGTLLDIDHGTYPFVTSSNCVAGAASPGAGVPPQMLNYVLGIVKAYTTRVGSGPFPTELFDDVGQGLGERGQEFGATTGRARRCGWFDAAALKRSIQVNGITGMCITKLDVMDGIDEIKIGVGYELADGTKTDILPFGADAVENCKPIYETLPGWSDSSFGVQEYDKLPVNAKAYLTRIAEICGAPIAMVSTGPDRDETIVLDHPFA